MFINYSKADHLGCIKLAKSLKIQPEKGTPKPSRNNQVPQKALNTKPF